MFGKKKRALNYTDVFVKEYLEDFNRDLEEYLSEYKELNKCPDCGTTLEPINSGHSCTKWCPVCKKILLETNKDLVRGSKESAVLNFYKVLLEPGKTSDLGNVLTVLDFMKKYPIEVIIYKAKEEFGLKEISEPIEMAIKEVLRDSYGFFSIEDI